MAFDISPINGWKFKNMTKTGMAVQGAGFIGTSILGQAISDEQKKKNPDSTGARGARIGLGTQAAFTGAAMYGAHPNNAASILGRMWKHGEIIKDV